MKLVAKKFTEIPKSRWGEGGRIAKVTKRERDIFDWLVVAEDGDCLEVENWKKDYKQINSAGSGMKRSIAKIKKAGVIDDKIDKVKVIQRGDRLFLLYMEEGSMLHNHF